MPVDFEQLRERAQPWMEPIPGASPSGVSVKLEPIYQMVTSEMAKLDMPAGGAIDWGKAIDLSSELLRSRTKDLMLASCLAHALHVTKGLDGLTTGVVLLAGMLERYWDTLFPEVKRLRGRANAVQWFLEKTTASLPDGELDAAEVDRVEALDTAARHLGNLLRERLGDAAPAMNPLLERIERLRLSAATPQPGPAAEPSPPSQPEPAPVTQLPSGAATPAALPEPVGVLGNAEDAGDFLRRIGEALLTAAGVLRRADSTDSTSYRLLRTGLWLHLSGPPPASAGRTQIAPLPEQVRERLQLMAQNQKWAALLEECESSVQQYRFALDLHRMSWEALGGLGSSHASARDALVIETRSLLSRMPQLPSLLFADGTPFADPQTRTWVAGEVLKQEPAGGARRTTVEPSDPATAARLAEAEKLLAANRGADGLALLQEGVLAARGGRGQFLARFELARISAGAGLTAIAKAIYQDLAEESAAKALDAWEPGLVADCLKGLMICAHKLNENPSVGTPDIEIHYRRLCRLDPAAAHEIGFELKCPHSQQAGGIR